MRSNLQRAVRSFVLIGVLGGAMAGVTLGADDPGVAPATQPTTQPVYVPQPSPNGPAASPAPAAGAPRTAATSIVMIPFSEIGADTQMEWVGRGIQQDLGADVARGSRLIVVTPTGASPAADPDAALKTARDVHAGLAVFGHFQVVGSDLRVTGQLLDVRSGQALAVLKATDNKQNLFHIEDELAQQIIAGLPQEMLTKANGSSGYPTTENPQYAPPSDGGQYAPPSGQYAQTQVPNYVPAPDNYQPSYDYQPQYEYPDTGYDYGPYYSGYGYPYLGGFYVYGGYGRYHDGWRHHDGHDGHDGGHDYHGANAYNGANAYHGGYVGGSPRSNIGGGARPSVSNGAHVGGGGGAHIGGGGGGAHMGGGGGGGHAGGGGHR